MQRAERNRKRAEREQKETEEKEADGDEYNTAKHLEVPWLSYRVDLFVNGRFHRV